MLLYTKHSPQCAWSRIVMLIKLGNTYATNTTDKENRNMRKCQIWLV